MTWRHPSEGTEQERREANARMFDGLARAHRKVAASGVQTAHQKVCAASAERAAARIREGGDDGDAL